MNNLTNKYLQILLALLSLLVLLLSFYFEYIKGLSPCPLCLMQRLSVGFLFLLQLLNSCTTTLRRGKLLSLGQLFFAAAGLFFAGRQLWLQYLPMEQASSCMPGLDVLIRYFPLQDVLKALMWGAGDCAEISWQWLGLSMPAWAALYFILIAVTALFQCCNLNKFYVSR